MEMNETYIKRCKIRFYIYSVTFSMPINWFTMYQNGFPTLVIWIFLYTGNVWIRSEASQIAGQDGHSEQGGFDTSNFVVPLGSSHHFPRDVGTDGQRVLALLKHHLLSLSAQRPRHYPTRRPMQLINRISIINNHPFS